MISHGITDVGKVRPENEDQFLIADLDKVLVARQTSLPGEHQTSLGGTHGYLLLVADGMGGRAAGELASKLAVTTLMHYVLHTMDWFFRLAGQHEDDLLGELEAALQQCHEAIQRNAATNPAHAGMGTTLTLAYVIWPRLYVLHVGDSRCYLLRDGELEQVTTDHTMAQRFVEGGTLTPEQAARSRWSHVLWNALGGGDSENMHPEVYKAELSAGDVLLLCTDGLSKHVDLETLQSTLCGPIDPAATCQKLVDLANAAGGSDNITAIVAAFPAKADSKASPTGS